MLESEWGTMSLSSNFYCFFYSDKNNIFHDKLKEFPIMRHFTVELEPVK